MPWSGGTYTKGNNATGGWTGDQSLGIGIEAGRHDTQDNDFATGINQCLNKDGSNSATGNLNLGGFKVSNVANATVATDVVTLGQAQTGIDQSTTITNFNITKFSADTDGRYVTLQKSRGATVGTNTIVQSGDVVGGIVFAGANGTGYTQTAAILSMVDGTPGATNDMPGRLSLRTTADGAGSTTERMVIKATGFVGIGLTDPSSPLNVQCDSGNAVGLSLRGRSADNVSVSLFTTSAGVETGRFQADSGALTINKIGNNPIVFNTNGNERMRITGAGRIGINQASPSSTLTLVNNESAAINTANIQSNVTGDLATHALIVTKFDNSTATTQRYVGFLMNGGASGSGQINANGANAAAFGSFSDERLKENIVDLPSQIDNFRALRPVEFDYKDGSGHQLGFIAQEVQAIFPDLVGESDGYLTLTDMNKNDARLIKAFQELINKVDTLETRIAALEEA